MFGNHQTQYKSANKKIYRNLGPLAGLNVIVEDYEESVDPTHSRLNSNRSIIY